MNEIEVRKSPRYRDAPDEDCMHFLVVNGFTLGAWYGGNVKKYEHPDKWAREQATKRLPVLERNIARLRAEADAFEKELQAIRFLVL